MAGLPGEFAQARPLGAGDEYARESGDGRGVEKVPLHLAVEADEPVPELGETDEAPHQIRHPGDREPLDCAGRGLDQGRRPPGRPVPSHDQGRGPDRLGGPDDRADVPGVGEPVECEDDPVTRRVERPDRDRLGGVTDRHHPLVDHPGRMAVEYRRIAALDRHPTFHERSFDVLRRLARQQDPLNRPGAGFEKRPRRMPAGHDVRARPAGPFAIGPTATPTPFAIVTLRPLG